MFVLVCVFVTFVMIIMDRVSPTVARSGKDENLILGAAKIYSRTIDFISLSL